MYIFNYILSITLAIFSFTACSTENARYIVGDTENNIVITSIQITPADVIVPKSTIGIYTAIAYYSDNTHKDVSTEVTWTSSDSNIIQFDSEDIPNHAIALHVGNATVNATLNSIISNTAKVEVTNAILTELIVTPSLTDIPLGLNVKYKATGIFSDNSSYDLTIVCNWSSSNTSVATIDGHGASTGIAITQSSGTTAIKASFNGISNILDATLNVTNSTITDIQVTPAFISVASGDIGTYTAIAHYTDGINIDITREATWESSTTSVVNIVPFGDNAGDAQATQVGNSTILASYDNTFSNTARVRVTNATLKTIEINPVQKIVAKGLTLQYQAIGKYSDNSTRDISSHVTWKSLDTAKATISVDGLASTHAIGGLIIKAYLDDIVSNDANLKVSSATVLDIQVTPANTTVPKGTSGNYLAIANFSDGSTQDITKLATWISTNHNIVSIETSTGFAKALLVGDSKITANYKGTTSNIAKVEVVQKTLTKIEIIADKTVFPKGTTVEYIAMAIYSDETAEDITESARWRSVASDIATVYIGEVVGIEVGTTEITIDFDGMFDDQTVTVTDPVITKIKVTPSHHKMEIGSTQTYLALAYYDNGDTKNISLDTNIIWHSSNSSIAIGYNDGENAIAEAIASGTTDITASYTNITSNIAKLIVLDESAVLEYIRITPLDENISFDSTLQYTAIAHYSNDTDEDVTDIAHWVSSDIDIATIGEDYIVGLARGIEFGTTTISATFNTKSASTSLHVDGDCGNSKPISIYILPDNATLSIATQLQYRLYGLWSNGCEMELTHNSTSNWESDDKSLVTIDKKDGIALGISAGTTSINTEYQTLTTNTNITVIGEEIWSVTIQPTTVNIGTDSSFTQYQCSAWTDNNGQADKNIWITDKASWSSSNTSVATIGVTSGSGDGALKTVNSTSKTGHSTITCYYGGKSSQSSLNVQ